jgi:hypothetical protein
MNFKNTITMAKQNVSKKKKKSKVTFLLKFNWLLVEINTHCTTILATGNLQELGTGGGGRKPGRLP